MEVRLGSIGGSLKKVPDCSIEKKKWIFGSLRSFLSLDHRRKEKQNDVISSSERKNCNHLSHN